MGFYQPEEIWVPVHDFPQYEVSNYGRQLNSLTNRILKPGAISNSGYIQFHFGIRPNRTVRYAHRVVAEAFIACNIEQFEVDHLDGNKMNNCVWNLELVTPKTNSQRAYDNHLRVPPSMKRIRIIETGEEFISLSECARYLNRTPPTVSYAALQGTKTAGVHVEYV